MIGTPISIFSVCLGRIWEPLTQQGVSGLFCSLFLDGDSFFQGGLLTHTSGCE